MARYILLINQIFYCLKNSHVEEPFGEYINIHELFFLSGHIINQCFEVVSAVGQTHIKKGTSSPL